jgi:hypothetical protein
MTEFALLIDNQFREIRQYAEKPADIPHKKFTWHEVSRETGEAAFTGLENGSWVIRAAMPTLEEARASKFSALASRRWQAETGGTTFNGLPLSTDAVSQTKYVGALVGAQIDPNATLKWKMADGSFVTLDAQTITAVAMAVRAHIQACFDREAELRTLVQAAASKAELEAIDINAGWPA